MATVVFQSDTQLEGFENYIIQQADDYEGEVHCRLIRKCTDERKATAWLHVHGFNDYFFHAEAAQTFYSHGIDWYSIDLRKSGRSYLSHQTFNGLRSIEEYFNDIHAALSIIRSEGATKIILNGHSLGGLVVSLFAAKNSGTALFDAVFLNSPFYEQNKDIFTKKLLVPFVSSLAIFFQT